MILLIDNYDSFTYNIVQYLQELGQKVHVVKNDEISIDEIERLAPEAIVLSPGPGTPERAGNLLSVIHQLGNHIPILGVCLGHQAIAMAYGATVQQTGRPVHGKTSEITHDRDGIFTDIPSPFLATRYHSLVVSAENMPASIEVTATTIDGTIMALRHTTDPVIGVQFHPEAALTEHGHRLFENFLAFAKTYRANTYAMSTD